MRCGLTGDSSFVRGGSLLLGGVEGRVSTGCDVGRVAVDVVGGGGGGVGSTWGGGGAGSGELTTGLGALTIGLGELTIGLGGG